MIRIHDRDFSALADTFYKGIEPFLKKRIRAVKKEAKSGVLFRVETR